VQASFFGLKQLPFEQLFLFQVHVRCRHLFFA